MICPFLNELTNPFSSKHNIKDLKSSMSNLDIQKYFKALFPHLYMRIASPSAFKVQAHDFNFPKYLIYVYEQSKLL